MTDVLVVGSLNADLVAYADRLPADGETVHGHSFARAAGGKGLNQAVAAARAGARTALLGCVGDDDLGLFLLDQARACGVLTDLVRVSTSTASGVAVITVDDAGTNRIVVIAGANAETGEAMVAAGLPTRPAPRVVLCQLETPMDGVAAALRAGRAAGALTVLNPAPAASLPEEVLAAVDWLIPNEFEASLVLGEALELDSAQTALAVAHRLRARGPHGVVITLGAQGAVAVDPHGTEHVLPAVPVTAIDTTAAGDAFCGGFAAALAGGLPVADALRRAGATGALATTRRGAVPSIPTSTEVDALLATGRSGGHDAG